MQTLTDEITVTTYDPLAAEETTHKVTIRELLGGENRRQRDTSPDAPRVYIEETLIENGIDEAIVNYMPASELRRVMNLIWDLSGHGAADIEEENTEGNS